MGAALCCIGSGACCAGQVCCKTVCCACSACGISPKNFPRLAYVIFSLFWALISIILMFTLKPVFEKVSFLDCNEASGGGSACFGTAAVVRMSFVLFIFHLMILIIISPRAQCSSAFHDGCWFLKFLLVIGLYIAVFWIPNDFYKGWNNFARIASGLYLILQVFMLIISAYTINDSLVDTYDSGQKFKSGLAGVGLVVLTTIITSGALALLIFCFIKFNSCAGTIVINVFTLLFVIAFYVLVILKTRPNSSIFTSSIVSAYVIYIAWSAMASIP